MKGEPGEDGLPGRKGEPGDNGLPGANVSTLIKVTVFCGCTYNNGSSDWPQNAKFCIPLS